MKKGDNRDKVTIFVERECAIYTPQLQLIVITMIKRYLERFYGKQE